MIPKKPSTLAQRFGFQDSQLTTPEHDAIMIWLDGEADSIVAKNYQLQWNEESIKAGEKSLNRVVKERIEESEREISRRIERLEEYSSLVEDHSKKHPQFKQNEINQKAKMRSEIDAAMAHHELIKGDTSIAPTPPYPQPKIKKIWEHPVMSGSYMIGFVDLKLEISLYSLGVGFEDRVLSWQVSRSLREMHFEVKPTIPSLGEVIRQIRMYEQYLTGKMFIVSPDTRFRSHLESQGIGFIESPKF